MTKAKDPKRVSANPARRFFVSMLIRDIELAPAIIDLVDNSADGAKRLRPRPGEDRYAGLFVNVEVAPDRFAIDDNCGGIGVDLARDYAFKFGRPEDAEGPIGEVGQFGIGMKRALFKMGERFVVESATATSRFSLPVDVRKWTAGRTNNWTFQFDRLNEGIRVPIEERGTNIVVDRLHKSVQEDFASQRFVNRLRRELAMRQLRLLQQGLRITVNDEPLVAPAPILIASRKFSPIHIEGELVVDDVTLNMKLWAGLAEAEPEDRGGDHNGKYRGEPAAGWYVFCNDRLLLYADKTRLTGWGVKAAAYHPQYSQFRGYVLLEGDARHMPWNTTKTGVDEDSHVFREAQSAMFDALHEVQTVINRLKRERRKSDKPARPTVKALDRAKPTPLSSLPISESFVTPGPAPDPPPTMKWIRYQVDTKDFEKVAAATKSTSSTDVGRATFEWYLEHGVG